MTVQVLVSTMHQHDHSLLDTMNIQTDAIVVNQCNFNSVEQFEYNGHSVLWISMNARGVGLSRNTALMNATGDILLFADDDVRYKDGYASIVEKFFLAKKNCDFAAFNLESKSTDRKEKNVDTDYHIRWFNCLKFGTYRLAVRRNSILNKRICFSLLFGGGAVYSCGEDSLFIVDCLNHGLRGLASSLHIGTVLQEDSTWFKGYNERYFYDRGVVMKHAFGIMAYPLAMASILKNPIQYKTIGLKKACCCALSGILEKQQFT